ncbi:putative gustatory receptor 2a [Malaya genurostris]|uniref:putative gustatory receptor 2a n=1 Tax=Malaya genurostris TaxID=325434 RepID=UPI0026F3FC71|nr:putative gustatory receptor 2a [Malaya genurostris]
MLPIKPFYYLSKLFGLCPYPLDAGTVSGKTRTGQAGHLLPTFAALLFYHFTMASIFWRSGGASEISAAANWIQFLPNSFAYVYAIACALQNRALSLDILSTIELCDEKLRNQLGICFMEPNSKVKRYTILASLVIVTCGSALCGLNFMIGVNWSEIWTLFYWIAFCMPKVGLLIFSFQFAGSIMLLSNRSILLLNAIDNYLGEIEQQMKCKPLGLIDFSNQDPPSYRKLTPVAPVVGSMVKVRPMLSSDTIETVGQVTVHLQQLATKINDCFGKQAIFSLLSAFISITVQLYYLLNQIRTEFAYQGAVLHGLAAGSILVLHGLEFWVLFTSGEKVRHKWRKLINCVFLAKAKSSDSEYRAKLDDLIAFMTCNVPEFHAYGFFPIDFSVLTGMASSITTYLIVLIQFKISEEEETGTQGKSTQQGTGQYSPFFMGK